MSLTVGSRLGHYDVTALIGEGGMEIASQLRRRVFQVLLLAGCTLSLGTVVAQTPDFPPIGVIDVYGLRTIAESDVRELLPLAEGAPLPTDFSDRAESLASDMAEALGVSRVEFSMGCCSEAGLSVFYVGIEETAGRRLEYHAPPTGGIMLLPEILASYRALSDVWFEAVIRSEAGEDRSDGHALSEYPPLRAIQEQFLIYAEQHREMLLEVLHESADAEHRAAAAMVLGYAPDKAGVTHDLEQAALDPHNGVRNNATRALAVIAQYGHDQPELGIEIRAVPFIDMLNSVVWTDRNKGLAVLESLTADRNPETLDDLQQGALPSLIEMCRWKTGHAYPACRILERMVGLPEQEELHPKETTMTKALALPSSDTRLKR